MDPNIFETANAGFAQAMYEEYLRDPQAVSAEWRRLFESGIVGAAPSVAGNGGSPASPPKPRPRPYYRRQSPARSPNPIPSRSRDPPPGWWRT